MITVDVYQSDVLVASAEADSPENALLAARTLWDEARYFGLSGRDLQGAHRARRVVFSVDDAVVRVIEGRRP